MIGIDLVHIPAFSDELRAPGSVFATEVFSPAEHLVARRRGLTDFVLERHLAGRWAMKEAFIKAWSQALFNEAPPIHRDSVNWRDIEVIPDAYGRVALRLSGAVGEAFSERFGAREITSASISHDGDYATAVVQISA